MTECQNEPRTRGGLNSAQANRSENLSVTQPRLRRASGAVNGGITFEPATQADDSEIRRLLRENPMAGRVSISLEREPDYFTEAKAFDSKTAEADGDNVAFHTIVAKDGGRVVCAGSCAIRKRFVNGQPLRVGYLGGLRLDVAYAGRFDVIRRGYQFFAELQARAPADLYFTSIAADNIRARRFLEIGVGGMPRYEFVGDFVTLMIPARLSGAASAAPILPKTSQSNLAEVSSIADILPFLNHQNSGVQFAPSWSPQDLRALGQLGLQAEDFCVLRDGGRIIATGALWDQRSFKQTVIRGYEPWLALSRFTLNGLARLTNRPRLPVIGETLASAFVSQLATLPDQSTLLIDLLRRLCGMARERRIQFLTLGFAADDPRLAIIRADFRCREYRSRIYVVHWPGLGRPSAELKNGLLAPEVSLL